MKTAIIGGDKRMLYAAKAFYDSGADVAIAGFDDLQSLCDIRIMPVKDALDWADCSVLPIRPLTDHCLNCSYSAEKYHIERFAVDNGVKPIFCGNAKSLSPYLHAPLYDYAAREDFAIKNAVLTAEGAIDLLFRCYEDSVYGAKVRQDRKGSCKGTDRPRRGRHRRGAKALRSAMDPKCGNESDRLFFQRIIRLFRHHQYRPR